MHVGKERDFVHAPGMQRSEPSINVFFRHRRIHQSELFKVYGATGAIFTDAGEIGKDFRRRSAEEWKGLCAVLTDFIVLPKLLHMKCSPPRASIFMSLCRVGYQLFQRLWRVHKYPSPQKRRHLNKVMWRWHRLVRNRQYVVYHTGATAAAKKKGSNPPHRIYFGIKV